MPEAMEITGTEFMQVLVSEPLPLTEVLLGEIVDHERLRSGDAFGSR